MKKLYRDIIQALRWYHIVGLYLVGILSSLLLSIVVVKILGITDTSDKIATMQTVLAISVFIPTFYALIQQLRKRPELDVTMEKGPRDFMPDRKTRKDVYISIINSGNAVGLWFTVTVFVPIDLVYLTEDIFSNGDNRNNQRLYSVFNPLVGRNTNWSKTYTHEGSDGYCIYTFMSNGQYAVYAHDTLQLLKFCLYFEDDDDEEMTYLLKYIITSDDGSKRKGFYVLDNKPGVFTSEGGDFQRW